MALFLQSMDRALYVRARLSHGLYLYGPLILLFPPSWHRYIPLGGRNGSWWNVWVIFGFVALWHDADINLLAWGGLNAGFFVTEQTITKLWIKYGAPRLVRF
mmetsp:Transcript_8466/g.18602  ORF Transcript_8466/g.18602 Transcript_8466/m.18602 type:complete len:102 (-) Transcript_8466:579-884(-)